MSTVSQESRPCTKVYVAAPEGNTGKSTVALGLIHLLAGSVHRVGVFRPVARSVAEPDYVLELLRDQATVDLPYDDCIGVSYDQVHEDVDAAVAQIVAKFHEVERQCDAVVIVGTDYTDVPYPTEFDFNAHIAANLGAPVVLVLTGFERSETDILRNAELTLRELQVGHAHPIGVIVNRCAPQRRDAVAAALGGVGVASWTLPEVQELTAPTVAELVAAVGGRLYSGDRELLQREVRSVMVGGMTAENILERLTDGTIVIVPADRTDVILAVLGAHGATGFPSLAGLIFNGGLSPQPMVEKLIEGMHSSLPIIMTGLGTFETGVAVAGTRGRVSIGSAAKVETALSLMEVYVDGPRLLQLLDVAIPSVVTPAMFEYQLIERAREDRRHIVLPEGSDDRILRAAAQLLRRQVAQLTILGTEASIRNRAKELGVDIDGAAVLDPATSPYTAEFAQEYTRLRQHKGMTYERALEKMQDISYFATMMVHLGLADGMVSGAAHTTAHTIKPSFEIIKTAPGVSTVSSIFLMCLPDHVNAYGDCAVVPDPTPEQLADIAISSAATAAQFGIDPKVALLSYSTGSSGSGADVDKVREAARLVKARAPELVADGPIQFDAAVDATVAASKAPDSPVAGKATVLIFPDLNTGNTTYKAVQRTAGAIAVGPVLQGLNKPINDLSRGALIQDIVNTVAITAIQAQGIAAAAAGTAAERSRSPR